MKRVRGIIKAMLVFLIAVIGLLFLTFSIINIPFFHRFVTQKINRIFISSNIPVHINSVTKVFPWAVNVEGVSVHGQEGDTIVYAGMVRSGFKSIALLKKKIILPSIDLESVRVNFIRNSGDEQLNIAEAFSNGKKPATADEPVKEDDNKSPWEVSVREAEISDLIFRMNDSVAGICISQNVKRIRIKTKKMSLLNKTVIASSLEIEGLTGSLTLDKIAVKDTAESGMPWNFGLAGLDAEDINFVFDDQVSKMKLDLLADEIKIKADGTEINNKIIGFTQVSLSRTNIALRSDNQPEDPAKDKSERSDVFPWSIHGDAIQLHDVSFSMAKYTESADSNPLSGFSLLGLEMSLSDLQIDSAVMNAELEKLKFDLGNGFSIREMNGNVDSRPGHTRIDLNVQSAGSRVIMEGMADGNIFDIIKDPATIGKASLSLRKTTVSPADIFYFRPDYQKNTVLRTLAEEPVNIGGEIRIVGSLLDLSDFTISQPGFTGITLDGTISDIFLPRKAVCDLKVLINEINYSRLKDVLKGLETEIPIPDFKRISIEATIEDSVKAPGFRLKMNSDLGNIALQGSFDYYHDMIALKSGFNNLNLGKILNNQMLGSFTGSGDFTGSGIMGKAINGEAAVRVDSLMFKGYNYQLLSIECSIQPDKYKMKLNVSDSSLLLKLIANISTGNQGISLNTNVSFLANLYNLHLYNDTITARGNLTADLEMRNGIIKTDVSISNIELITPEDSASIKKITVSLNSDSLNTSFVSASDFFSAEADIGKKSGDPGTFLNNYIIYLRSLFDSVHPDSTRHLSSVPVIKGNITMEYHNVLRILVPDTNLYFRNLSFTIGSDIAKRAIWYTVKGKEIRNKTFEVGNFSASLTDSVATLDLNVRADTCVIGPQPINNIRIKSHFANWHSLTNLSIIDKEARLIYHFEISSETDSNNVILKIPSEQIILNGAIWNMESPELLVMDLRTKSLTPTVRMHNNGSSLSFLNDQQAGWDNYNLELNNVSLVSFLRSDLLPGEPELAITGFIRYGTNSALGDKLTTQLQFNDVKWSDLNYKQITLNSSLLSDTAGNFDFNIDTRLDTSVITIKGTQQVNSNRNITATIKQIPVNTIQPFVRKYISDLSGKVSGEFNLTSKEEVNTLNGDLYIEGGKLRVNSLNAAYRMPQNRIRFTGKKMVFKDFEVHDSLDNKLSVNGSVDFSHRNSVTTDLGIGSFNLQILNKKEDKNANFYGDIFIDTKLSVRGLVSSPVLKGKITLAKGTDIYFRQKENLNLSESGNILTFVSKKPVGGQPGQNAEPRNSIYNKSSVESIVEIDPSTRINVEISKKMFNIDMTIKGGGELSYNMLVNSQVNMSGKYEINEGGANLKMVGWPNKAFKLTSGGFIRWDGKLDDPELNIEAINRVKSSYTNPVDNKERYVDFDVTLKITNRLSVMDVSFTINTPDQYLMSIINTMSPEEQMRQAITILLFEYIDLPGISTSSNYVSEQVNQMVAAQLNSLTKTTIKGIDISFGIDTYTQGTSSGGQQTKTSLSYEVKKNLLNDRAKVEFSGIVSDASNQSKSSNTSLNNFTFEYRIDSAATKFLKVYNEHTYEDVFEGEVVKTGLGFTYRKSYPSLGDIWRKKKKVSQSNNPDR